MLHQAAFHSVCYGIKEQLFWLDSVFVHDDVINGNIFRVTGPSVGNSPVTGEFPAQRPVTRSLDVFFDLRLNKLLSKQS